MTPESTVYIGVHPYSPFGSYDDQLQFVKERNRRLTEPKIGELPTSQILFLNRDHIDGTQKKFPWLIKEYWNGRIYLTDDFAGPLGKTAQEISIEIQQKFPANNYIIWGAELWPYENGCVRRVYNQLNLPNTTIDEDACWKVDLTN